MISSCYQMTGKYEKALIYLKKMLKLAWFIRDQDSELVIYD